VLASRDTLLLIVWTNQVESYIFTEMRIVLFSETCDGSWLYFVHKIIEVHFIAVILEIFRVGSAF